MIEGLKPFYNAILRPFGRFFGRLGIHPNVFTVGGVVVYGAVAWLLAEGRWRTGVAVGVAGACLDGLDGIIARECGKKSVFGAVLDSTCDRITEIMVILGVLAFYLRQPRIDVLAAILCLTTITGSLMVSYVKARAEGAGLVCNKGILQRPERLFILGGFLLAGPKHMIWGLGIVSILSYLTAIQRLIIAYNASKADNR